MITHEQLLEVFAAYNSQIWPMQVVAYVLGIASLLLAIRRQPFSNRVIIGILAFFWLWVAFMFWLPSALQGFAPAYIFAGIFLVQGVLFLYHTIKPNLSFGLNKDLSSLAGILFALYALVGYPLVGVLSGNVYPRIPPFGLTPCPLVTFTFGLLLLTDCKVPKTLMIIPFFYSLSGILWVSIGVWEDIGMVASGLVGTGLIWVRDARQRPNLSQSTTDQMPSVESGAAWSLDIPDKH